MFKKRHIQVKIVRDDHIETTDKPVKVFVVRPEKTVERMVEKAVMAYALYKTINLASSIAEAYAVKQLA
jgi:hypothetical protein